MRTGSTRRKGHHGDTYLVAQTGVGNALPAVNQIVYIIQRIEIPDGRNSVFLKHFSV